MGRSVDRSIDQSAGRSVSFIVNSICFKLSAFNIFILQLFMWRNGEFQEVEDLLLPDVARSVVWSKESLCVGFKREYSLIKVCATPPY